MLSAFPQDDRHIIGLMRAADASDLEYVAGYADVDTTVDLLASASLVVAERLHAAILAAAGGTPFVALEYWPKHRDFARSIEVEDLVVSTDGLTSDRLIAAVDAVSGRADEVRERIAVGVHELRRRQREAADRLQRMLRQR